MSKHLQRDLDLLKRNILTMGSLVEDALRDALNALLSRDGQIAAAVIHGDREIDQRELEIENECLKILALHQPVAADLRFLVTVLKVNNDLERIADLAVNIAKRARSRARTCEAAIPAEITLLATRVRSMVKRSLDALVKLDPVLAREVCQDDDVVDEIHKRMFSTLQATMSRDPGSITTSIGLLSVSRYLERAADLATNIAEDVVFTVEGEVIRHGGLDETEADTKTLLRPDSRRPVRE